MTHTISYYVQRRQWTAMHITGTMLADHRQDQTQGTFLFFQTPDISQGFTETLVWNSVGQGRHVLP